MPEQAQQKQPADSSTQATPKKGISWKKIIVSVVVIVMVAGIISGLLWYFACNQTESSTTETTKVSTPSSKQATPSAKKDETANWNTLTNTGLGYSIKYSASWKTKRCTYPAENSSTSDLIDPTKVEYTTGDVCASGHVGNILIVIGRSDKNYSQKLAEWEQYYSSAEHSNYKKTNVKVGALAAVKFSAITTDQNLTFGKKAGVILLRYLVDDGKDKPLVVRYNQDTTDDNYQSIFDKMLSTFKFLD